MTDGDRKRSIRMRCTNGIATRKNKDVCVSQPIPLLNQSQSIFEPPNRSGTGDRPSADSTPCTALYPESKKSLLATLDRALTQSKLGVISERPWPSIVTQSAPISLRPMSEAGIAANPIPIVLSALHGSPLQSAALRITSIVAARAANVDVLTFCVGEAILGK